MLMETLSVIRAFLWSKALTEDHSALPEIPARQFLPRIATTLSECYTLQVIANPTAFQLDQSWRH